MAPVNFLEYGKSYGSRLYGKTPWKYLQIEFKLKSNSIFSSQKHWVSFDVQNRKGFVQDIAILTAEKLQENVKNLFAE